MGRHARALALVGLVVLSGCSASHPPPGWPSGEERPINPTQSSKVVR